MVDVAVRRARRARREFGWLTVNVFAILLIVITACVAASMVLLVVRLGQFVFGS